jgi:hypothetical protein
MARTIHDELQQVAKRHAEEESESYFPLIIALGQGLLGFIPLAFAVATGRVGVVTVLIVGTLASLVAIPFLLRQHRKSRKRGIHYKRMGGKVIYKPPPPDSGTVRIRIREPGKSEKVLEYRNGKRVN